MLKIPTTIGAALISSCLLLVGMPSFAVQAALPGVSDAVDLDPSLKWRTIETEHFRVTFPEELERTANRAANLFEEAHLLLSPRLLWSPLNRTQVLIVDNTDLANGFATPVARIGVVLMVTPPEDWYSTSYYDDWLRLLVLHEYTHFLNMDITRGIWTPLRYVFGDVFLPNSALHPWLLEGLAVYMETRLTRAGRGRSPYYDMLLRSSLDIHLDQLNGPNPYYPGGEIRYFSGYQLFNQLASEVQVGPTADARDLIQSSDHALGLLSYRSGLRFPFFINGNLENITGKNWYQIWNSWQAATQKRITADLEKLRSEPESQIVQLTENNFQTFGGALSPDGKWLAYTADSSDRRMGLFLREQKTGIVRRLIDKFYGTGISFSADSSTLFFSAVGRTSNYTTFSDLHAYSLDEDTVYALSSGLRARDPSVSRDGQWVVFTLTQDATTGLAITPLLKKEDRFELGPVERVFMPAVYDRVSNPVFSKPDGSEIVFSLHTNGQASQEIIHFDRKSGQISALVKNGKFNRQPAVSRAGEIYYISDLTGVDNLYRYRQDREPELVSNVTTGLAFPFFSAAESSDSSEFHAAYFSGNGWNLARSRLLAPLPINALTISEPPAPKAVVQEQPWSEVEYNSTEYSATPSIWPRQWAPLLGFDVNRAIFGGQMLGFDAIDRHRYFLLFTYDTLTAKPDWLVTYTNRMFWPTVTLSAENTTSAFSGLLNYTRRARLEVELSRAWLNTYSRFNTALAFRADRSFNYERTDSSDRLIFAKKYVPSADLALEYSDTETSRLAVVPEGGGRMTLAGRSYLDDGLATWKALYIARQYLRISDHSVAIPKLKGAGSSRTNFEYFPANVTLEGNASSLTSAHASDSLDQLGIRGYPLTVFYARNANVFSLDYYFPLLRVFRGIGTAPVFFENFYGFVFGETSLLLSEGRPARSLPSAGAGVKLSTRFFFEAPVEFTIEYDYGFRKQARGRGELFAVISAGALLF
ncbi:MAG TPA: hypothetical protein DCS07_06105 [Bdellovibrionales bacterium]|nr:hypothetical protein [Bdellovibrionales bacterium]